MAARLRKYAAEIDEILISDTYQLIKSDFLCAPKTNLFKGYSRDGKNMASHGKIHRK